MRKVLLAFALCLLPTFAHGLVVQTGTWENNRWERSTEDLLPGDVFYILINEKESDEILIDSSGGLVLKKEGAKVDFDPQKTIIAAENWRELAADKDPDAKNIVLEAKVGTDIRNTKEEYQLLIPYLLKDGDTTKTRTANVTIKVGAPSARIVKSISRPLDQPNRFTAELSSIPPNVLSNDGFIPVFEWEYRENGTENWSAISPVPQCDNDTSSKVKCSIVITPSEVSAPGFIFGVVYDIRVTVKGVVPGDELVATTEADFPSGNNLRVIISQPKGQDEKWVGNEGIEEKYTFAATPNGSLNAYANAGHYGLWVLREEATGADISSVPTGSTAQYTVDQRKITPETAHTFPGDPLQKWLQMNGIEAMQAGRYAVDFYVLQKVTSDAHDNTPENKRRTFQSNGDTVYLRQIERDTLTFTVVNPDLKVKINGLGPHSILLPYEEVLDLSVELDGIDEALVGEIEWRAGAEEAFDPIGYVDLLTAKTKPNSQIRPFQKYIFEATMILTDGSRTTGFAEFETQADCDDPQAQAQYPNECFGTGSGLTGRKGELLHRGQCVPPESVNSSAIGWYENGAAMALPIPPLVEGTDGKELHWCFCYERPVVNEFGEALKRLEWYQTVLKESANGDSLVTAKRVNYCVPLQDCLGDVCAISGDNGFDLFSNSIRTVYRYGAFIIGSIVVLILVWSGIQMMLGGANSALYEDAKMRILQALLSMGLLFSSAMILQAVNPYFFRSGEVDVADSDADGLPDWWEREHRLDPFDPQDSGFSQSKQLEACNALTPGNGGDIDLDGDGVCNYLEYVRGTDPQYAEVTN